MRVDLKQFSRVVEIINQSAYTELFEKLADFEQQHPEAANPKNCDACSRKSAWYKEGKRPLNHLLIEYKWRFHAFTKALAHPTRMHFMICTICQALVDGEGDLLQEFD